MSNVVSWNLQLSINDGNIEAARSLCNEMVEAVKAEAGTTEYQWFVNEKDATCHICEGYADNDAVMAHLGNFGANFMERFMATFTPTAFHVYGNPSDQARGVLDGFSAVYLKNLGGFSR